MADATTATLVFMGLTDQTNTDPMVANASVVGPRSDVSLYIDAFVYTDLAGNLGIASNNTQVL